MAALKAEVSSASKIRFKVLPSFFIVTAEAAPWLDGKHTNFGYVVSGMQTVQIIASVETNEQEHPMQDIIIESIELFNATIDEEPEETTDEVEEIIEEPVDNTPDEVSEEPPVEDDSTTATSDETP